jgi:hypothetical protein
VGAASLLVFGRDFMPDFSRVFLSYGKSILFLLLVFSKILTFLKFKNSYGETVLFFLLYREFWPILLSREVM